MYILNTTFVIPEPRLKEFTRWVREVYEKALDDAGIFTGVTLAKVLTQVEPDTVSVAVQTRMESLEEAKKWHDTTAVLLKDDLRSRFLGQALFFTTYMEEL